MANLDELIVTLKADLTQFQSGIAAANALVGTMATSMDRAFSGGVEGIVKMQESIRNLSGALFSWKSLLEELAIMQIIDFGVDCVKAYATLNQEINRLNATLGATGRYSDEGSKKILANAERVSQATAVSTKSIIEATNRFALFAKGLNSNEIAQASEAIVGFSQATGRSMDSVALIMGRAVSTTTSQMGRLGVVMDKSRDQHVRFGEIVAQAASKFQVAVALAQTLEGRWNALGVAVEHLKETIGSLLVEGLQLSSQQGGLTNTIKDLNKELENNRQYWVLVMRTAMAEINFVWQGVQFIGNAIGTLAAGLATAVLGIVSIAMHAIQEMLNDTLGKINLVLAVANSIPGVKLGQMSQVKMTGGIDYATQFAANATTQMGTEAFLNIKNASQGFQHINDSIDNPGHMAMPNGPYDDTVMGPKAKAKKDPSENFILKVNVALAEQEKLYDTISTKGQEAFDKMKEHMDAVSKVADAHLKVSQAIKNELVRRIELTENLKSASQGVAEALKSEEAASISKGSLAAYLQGGAVGQKQYDQAATIQSHIDETPGLRDNQAAADRYRLSQQQKNLNDELKAQQIAWNDQLVISDVNQLRLNESLKKGYAAYNDMVTVEAAEAWVKANGAKLSDQAQADLLKETIAIMKNTQAEKDAGALDERQLANQRLMINTQRELNAAKQGFTYNPITQQFELKGLEDTTKQIAAETQALSLNHNEWTEKTRQDEAMILAQDKLSKSLDDLKTHQQAVIQAAQAMGKSFEDAFGSIIDGTTTVKAAIGKLLQDIAKMVYEQTAGKWISNGIAGLIANIFGGGAGGGFIGMPGGETASGAIIPRASGGPVSSGQPYLVGENGPELFIPHVSGGIRPNGASGGGSVHVVIQQSFQTGVSQTIRAEMNAMMPAILNKSTEAFLGAVKKGGRAAAIVGVRS